MMNATPKLSRAIVPGVLALQGSVAPHRRALTRLGYSPREVRRSAELAGVTHLILPGGESTTFVKLLTHYRIWDTLRDRGRDGSLALFGTCAGTILLGRESPDPPERLGLIDIAVDRNAYGRQIDSFIAPLELVPPLEFDEEGVFIRAPRIRAVGPAVEILGRCAGDTVLVRSGRVLASTFHPELTENPALHSYFLTL